LVGKKTLAPSGAYPGLSGFAGISMVIGKKCRCCLDGREDATPPRHNRARKRRLNRHELRKWFFMLLLKHNFPTLSEPETLKQEHGPTTVDFAHKYHRPL
jgi:hypothetical protein